MLDANNVWLHIPLMKKRFTGSFTQQEPISDDAIAAAVQILQHGRLHRYNVADGEAGEAALLEQEFAHYMGAKYALAVASGGYAIATALRALGVAPGDKVLTCAFTLAPVPGAIASLGAVPVYVETTPSLVIDLDDLAAKSDQSNILLLSHMRGHICDMDRLMDICDTAGIRVVEDCAHTLGARWNGVLSGLHGVISAYSTQTYKHLNSGEGGLLISDDAELMARAILLSGSYMLYERHLASPAPEVFEAVRQTIPNTSGRMDNLRAAILRPQLRQLDEKCAAWNARYRAVEEGLEKTPGLTLINRPKAEAYVMSSFQFLLLDWSDTAIKMVLQSCAKRGVELKWFGAQEPAGFTSRYDTWRFAETPVLPKTDRVLKAVLDMRLPLTFSIEECALIASIIDDEVSIASQLFRNAELNSKA